MNEKMQALCSAMETVAREHGLTLEGVKLYEPRQGQRKSRELYACFAVGTHDPTLLGAEHFDVGERMGLGMLAYEALGRVAEKPDYDDLALDVRPVLMRPYQASSPLRLGHGTTEEVLTYAKAAFIPIQGAIADGSISGDSMFAEYCARYDLPYVLKHRRHFVSPDSASVEAFEAALSLGMGRSTLEIGSGVGICGVAARRAGVRDFTFTDISAPVCSYLRERFPEYPVVEKGAFEVPLERQWEMALIGIPYHLNPEFLESRGQDLAAACDIAVFNSGSPAFFDFDHDRLMDEPGIRAWPWYREAQTARAHFRYVAGLAFDWQTVVVAGHDPQQFARLVDAMYARGFTLLPPKE